jgi:hypothetical protein
VKQRSEQVSQLPGNDLVTWPRLTPGPNMVWVSRFFCLHCANFTTDAEFDKFTFSLSCHEWPHHISIVSSSILSALAGHYGDYHATPRTRESKLWINPLMSLYWCFRLTPVAQRILYLAEMKQTDDYMDVMFLIESLLINRQHIKARTDIPV